MSGEHLSVHHNLTVDGHFGHGCSGHGRFSHGRFDNGHAPLDVLATENIQGGRFGYIIFL